MNSEAILKLLADPEVSSDAMLTELGIPPLSGPAKEAMLGIDQTELRGFITDTFLDLINHVVEMTQRIQTRCMACHLLKHPCDACTTELALLNKVFVVMLSLARFVQTATSPGSRIYAEEHKTEVTA
jgi:hypothetical protein